MRKVARTGLVIAIWVGLFFLAKSHFFVARYYSLTSLFLMVGSATAFFPLPTNVLVLLASQSINPFVAALVGGMATPVAFLLEYQIYTWIIKRGKVLDIGRIKIFPRLFESFGKAPFWILAIASFLPIPAEPLRLYAISERYKRWKFALAGFAGRLPRYLLISGIGARFGAPAWLIVAIVLLPVPLVIGNYIVGKIRKMVSKTSLSYSSGKETVSSVGQELVEDPIAPNQVNI